MKQIIWFTILFLAQTVCGGQKPNIIVIYTDDHGWPDIGAAGIYDDLKTPNIDVLAASGVRATNGYVTAPQCVPSRGGLLSGRSQNRFGLEGNGNSLEGFNAQVTIADRMKKAGYATGQIGKWHLGPNEKITDHGFDDVYSKNSNRPCQANYTLDGETIKMQMVDDGLYHLDACSDAALTFIDRHADSPFFLYLAYRAPHVPLDAPKKYLDRFPGEMPERRRQALAMISAMDDGVGAIVGDLKKRGLTEKTLIFFIGDNGAPLKIHKHDAPGGGPGWDGSLNEPMNGEKGMLSEGGIRVPFVVSWPGRIPEGQIYDEPIWSLDVAATANALAGQPEDKEALDGVNLIPYLSGEKKGSPHEFLTWRWISQAAIREGNWKLLRGGDREYLFDIVADPEEKRNLLKEHPKVADRLRTRLTGWTNELQPPGLATSPMSQTWSDYFDFYLEGKTPPPSRSKFQTAADDKSEGWIARNGSVQVKNGALMVTPQKKGRQSPFIVQSRMRVNGPLVVEVKLRSTKGGAGGFAWRLDGQKDFSSEQTVRVEVPDSADWQTMKSKISTEGKVIHLRVLLPPGESAIQRIILFDAAGKRMKVWEFKK